MSIDPNSLQNDHLWRFGDRAHFPSMGSQLPKHIPGVFGRKSQEFGGFWDVFFLGGTCGVANFMLYNYNQSLFDRYLDVFFEATHTFFWGQLLTIVTRSSLWRWCQLLTAFWKTMSWLHKNSEKKREVIRFSHDFPCFFHESSMEFSMIFLAWRNRWCFGHHQGESVLGIGSDVFSNIGCGNRKGCG